MRVVFERRENLTSNIWQYFFRPDARLGFLPGQYADLHLTGVKSDSRGASRVFSFTNLPDEPEVSFVLKHFEKQSPYKQALEALVKGDPAKIDNPMGDLVLPKSPDIPLVFVAGGIGVASFAGMIRQLMGNNERRRINFFYQLREQKEQIFNNLIDRYGFEQKEVLVRPSLVTAEQIKSSATENSLIYLSGAQKFVEDLQAGLERLGTPRASIIFDYYDGYTEL